MQLLTQVLQQSVIQTHSPPGSVSDVSSSRGGVVAHAHQVCVGVCVDWGVDWGVEWGVEWGGGVLTG